MAADGALLRAAVASHGKRLDGHSERIRDLELHRAHAQTVESEMRAQANRIEERLDSQDVKLGSIDSRLAALGGRYAVGTAVASAVAAAVLSWVMSRL